MTLHTYTGLWTISRRLYKIYDIQLIIAPTYAQLVVFLGVGIPYWLLLHALGVLPMNIGMVIYLAVPGGLGSMAGKPMADRKRFGDWFITQFRYLTGARFLSGGTPMASMTKTATLSVRHWTPSTRT